MVTYVAGRLDRAGNQRIGVLPFPSSANPREAGPLGRRIARQVWEGLRKRGFFDLVTPTASRLMISRAGISPMAIDYEPSLTRGRLGVDYLIVGWLRGDETASAPRPALAADNGRDNPGSDAAYEPRERAIDR